MIWGALKWLLFPVVFMKAKDALSGLSGYGGILNGIIPPNGHFHTIAGNPNSPKIAACVPINTMKPALVSFLDANIPTVFCVRHLPQVAKAVVASVAVYVVNVHCRPFTMHYHPNDAVRLYISPQYSAADIPQVIHFPKRAFPGVPSIPRSAVLFRAKPRTVREGRLRTLFPKQETRFRFIPKELPNDFRINQRLLGHVSILGN